MMLSTILIAALIGAAPPPEVQGPCKTKDASLLRHGGKCRATRALKKAFACPRGTKLAVVRDADGRGRPTVAMWCRTTKDAKAQGPYVQWRHDGSVAETATYKGGKWSGARVLFDANGRAESRASYRKGEMHGLLERWWPNGKRQELLQLKDGVRHGKRELFYDTGKREERATYKDGKLQGLRTRWHANGGKDVVGRYVDDKVHGKVKWWRASGEFQEMECYDMDKKLWSTGSLSEGNVRSCP